MHLPFLPSDEVLQAVLPWWTNQVMLESRKLGVQHHAKRYLYEAWRLQDAVPWTKDGVPAISDEDGGIPAPWLSDYPQPDEDALTAFRAWEFVVTASYGAEQGWCGYFGDLGSSTWKNTDQGIYSSDGYGVDGYDPDGYDRDGLDRDGNPKAEHLLMSAKAEAPRRSGPPPWSNVIKTRKW